MITVLSFALLVLAAIFALGNSKIGPLNQELSKISKKAQAILTNELKDLEIDALSSLKSKTQDKLNSYKNVFRKDFLISEKLEVLSGLIPEGVWLEEMSFDRNGRRIYFRGLVYRDNETEAADAPYKFIANLKSSPLFSNKVANISVKSLRSSTQRNYKVSKFEIEIGIII
jgi:Tfp pilus assembly protein PilN